MIPVRITLRPGASVPAYQTAGAAGADVFACTDGPVTIAPGAVAQTCQKGYLLNDRLLRPALVMVAKQD